MELFIFFFVTRFIVFVDNFWLRTSIFQSRAYHDTPVGIVKEETFRGLSAKALASITKVELTLPSRKRTSGLALASKTDHGSTLSRGRCRRRYFRLR